MGDGRLAHLCASLGLGLFLSSRKISRRIEDVTVFIFLAGGQSYTIRIYHSSRSTLSAKDEVATLIWLKSKRLPVVSIAAYDFSFHNEIGEPFVLERNAPGRPAYYIYGTLSLDEQIQVVDAVAHAMSQIRDITFEQAGKIVAAKDLRSSADVDVDELLPFDKYLRIVDTQISDSPGASATMNGPPPNSRYAQKLEDAIEQMAEDPFFFATASEPCSLFLRDFLPREVILAKNDEGRWALSGLTCRDAWSFKETAAASPPSWLWGGVSEQQSMAAQVSTTSPQPFSTLAADRLVLKKRFDQAMSTKKRERAYYMQQTYGIGKWFRRMMHCEHFLMPSTRYPNPEIERFLQGWAEYAELHGLNCATPTEQRSSIVASPEQESQPLPLTQKQAASPEFRSQPNTTPKRSVHVEQSIIYETESEDDAPNTAQTQWRALCNQQGLGEMSHFYIDPLDFTITNVFCGRNKIRYMVRMGLYQDIKDEVACHLKAGAMIESTTLVAYDARRSNALGAPFVLYKALSGQRSFFRGGPSHTSESRFRLADELAAVANKLAMTRLSSAGKVMADPLMPDLARYPNSRSYAIKSFVDDPTFLRPGFKGFFSSLLRHQASSLPSDLRSSDREKVTRAYTNLHLVLCQMAHAGILNNPAYSECVLVKTTHSSNVFISRNRQQPDEDFELEGFANWSEAISLPKILAFPPPTWLWHVSVARGGYWWLAPLNQPSKDNHSDRAVMQRYDSAMKVYMLTIFNSDEHEQYFHLIRQLGYFALEGNLEKQRNYRLYEQFLEDWDNHCRGKSWFEYRVSRPAGYRPSWSDTVSIAPNLWSEEWNPTASRKSSSASILRPANPPQQSSSSRAHLLQQLPESESQTDINGFASAHNVSDLTIPEREKYYEVESRILSSTSFGAITSALHRSNGSVKEAIALLNGPQPGISSPSLPLRTSQVRPKALPAEPTASLMGHAVGTSSQSSRSSASIPSGPRPMQSVKLGVSSALKDPRPPQPLANASTSLAKPPGTTAYNSSRGPPPSLANPNARAQSKRSAPDEEDKMSGRETKKAKSDPRLERARHTVQTAMEPAVEYPLQVYTRGERGPLPGRNVNRGQAPPPSSDDECMITEVRKLRLSSEGESEGDSDSESESESEESDEGEQK